MSFLIGIVFDLDGTLVDSRRDIAASVLRAVERVGGRPRCDAETIGAGVGRPLAELLRLADPDLDASRLDAAAAAYREHYFDHCADASVLFPGARRTLAALAGRPDVRLGLATTKRPRGARRVAEAFGLADYFAALRGTAPDMAYKPAPDLIVAVADDLGLPPSALVYVGDTPTDLIAARAAGARSAWASWGYGDPQRCRAQDPDVVLARLEQAVQLADGGMP